MKKVLILIISLFISGNIQSQILWLTDFDAAKSAAKKSGKLIVMDFWAPWCGPCTVMDRELWHNPELLKFSNKFVGLKINTDIEKTLAATYNTISIPKVIILTVNGDIIWEKEGFDYAGYFLPVFAALPENVGEINKKSILLEGDKKNSQANYSVGIEFQRVAKNIKNNEIRISFLDCSGKYLSKAEKLSNDAVLSEEIELNSILNDVYYGRHQKALKRIEKMDSNPPNENIAELRHYILAMCYKGTSDQDNFLKEKHQIKTKEFIDQLEN